MSERAPAEAPKPRPPKSQEDRDQDRLLDRLESKLGLGRYGGNDQAAAPQGSHWGEGTPLSEVFGGTDAAVVADSPTPAEKQSATPSEVKITDKRNEASKQWSFDMKNQSSEEEQAKLDAVLNEVESTPVPETPFVEEEPITAPAVTVAAVEAPVPTAEAKATPAKVEKTDSEAAKIAELEAAFNAPAAKKETSSEVETHPHKKRAQQSHHDFHTERPAPAIQRVNNTSFQHAAGTPNAGKFATAAEYEIQNGSFEHNSEQRPNAAQEHYDKLSHINEGEVEISERPDYANMNTDELVFAAAKAELIGDKAVVDQAHEVFEEEYSRPGSTMTFEDYESAVQQFDRLVEIAVEYEKAKDPEHYELVDAAVERANRGPSVGERVKAFWKKGAEKLKMAFRPEYWGERFTAAATKVGEASTWALNLGVKETDSDEEKDKKRNRNRVFLIAGGLAVTAGAIAASYGIGFAVGSGSHGAAAEAAGNLPQGGGGSGAHHGASVGEALSQQNTDTSFASEQQDQHRQMAEIANANTAPATPTANNHGEYTLTPVDQLPDVGPPASGAEFSINDPGFTIHDGEGGYELFNNLNIPDSVWDANKATLLQRFPNDFYPMGNGAVGVEGGQLSADARTFINTLRS